MTQLKQWLLTFTVVFSEIVWIYYAIVLNTSIEWKQQVFFNMNWWIIACFSGYILSRILAGKVQNLFLFGANTILLGIVIVLNWKSVIPDGHWFFGFIVSVAIGFGWLRSAGFAFKAPTRVQMLRHFEGNIILYIVFALFFSGSQWITTETSYHFYFIVLIILSLFGMILSLQNQDEDNQDHEVEIRKVGHSSWFTVVIILLIGSIILLSSILLVPSLRHGILVMTMSSWEALKWVGASILAGITWLVGLFPSSNSKEILPMPENGGMGAIEQQAENVPLRLPIARILAGVTIIIALTSVWVLSKYVRKRPTLQAIQLKKMVIHRESWWKRIKEKLISLKRVLQKNWRKRFSYYYHEPIYWYFHQVQEWGRKNNIKRLQTETAVEYMERLIAALPESEQAMEHKIGEYHIRLSEFLRHLVDDYQAVYYGASTQKRSLDDYKRVLHELKKIQL